MSTSLLDYDDSRQWITTWANQTGAGSTGVEIKLPGALNILSARWTMCFAASGQGLATAALAPVNKSTHVDGSFMFSVIACKGQTGGGMNLTRWEPLFIRYYQAASIWMSIVVSAGTNCDVFLTLEVTPQ